MENNSRYYTVKTIADVTGGTLFHGAPGAIIDHLVTDSRRIIFPGSSLFFALPGPRRNGQEFIPDLYQRGVRYFVVQTQPAGNDFTDAGFIVVPEVLEALQALAAWHRKQFQIPVIGITGSNGKTIVKEWLNQLLEEDFNIVRSPRSYNSQIGVPLSVWQIRPEHSLGIFEAGISMPGEMEKLEPVIQPTLGVFTNLGEAHQEGFSGFRQKAIEKFRLFRNCTKLVYCKDNISDWLDLEGSEKSLLRGDIELFTWSRTGPARLQILKEQRQEHGTIIVGLYHEKEFRITIPFQDRASVDNAITCCCVLLAMGFDTDRVSERMKFIRPVGMRLELKRGINNCSVINDSYSADLSSLNIALDFLVQQRQHRTHTVILSDFLQTGIDEKELYEQVASALRQRGINRMIGVGTRISAHREILDSAVEQTAFFLSTQDLITRFQPSQFRDEAILVKGARVFEFEQVSRLLEQKVHQTVLEINLSNLVHNLKQYQRCLKSSTKIMAMVKAFSYGSGSYEIANILQFHKIDYLAVAYADEGIELRKAGITLPIAVMNPEENSFGALLDHNLEPAIFSKGLLLAFEKFLKSEAIPEFPIHIKIDSGMHRLGFELHEVDGLAQRLSGNNWFKVQSVFSHLAASEDPAQDEFTRKQAGILLEACRKLETSLNYTFMKHIANSAAIVRHPELQFDMVRLGIGLYGVDSAASGQLELKEMATLKTTIAQIRELKAGETIGYGRQGLITRDSRIATIRIGYADGFRRNLGNGVGNVLVRGKLAPVLGQIAMDMAMIDITGIMDLSEGDEVLIFGEGLSITRLAQWAQTIPYEIMTGISQRVQRVYFEE